MRPSPISGAIRQIGYVVTDLDSALKSWLAAGVGPWFVLSDLTQRAQFRGHACEVPCSIALANSGPLQIELIQQLDDTPSVYTEFLADGEGFHQLAYWPEDFDAALAAVEKAGWPILWRGGEDSGVSYAYVEPPGGPAAVIELMEFNTVTQGLAQLVRDAAEGWDGITDPIRAVN